MTFLQETSEGMVISVQVSPGASKSRVVGPHGDSLKVAVAAAPEKGKANDELVRFFAKRLGVKKSQVSVVSGETSRFKRVLVCGVVLTAEDLLGKS